MDEVRLRGALPPASPEGLEITLSIRSKLLLLIVVSTLSVAGIVTFSSIRREASRFLSAQRAEIEATALVFASATAEAALTDSRGDALRVLRAIGKLPRITYSGIERADGRILAEFGENIQLLPSKGWSDESPGLLALIGRQSMHVGVPIIAEGEEIGRLNLIADTSELAKNAWASLRDALIAAIVAIFAGFGLAFWVQRLIVARIAGITQAMRHIAEKHDYSRRVDAQGGDELDAVSKSFNAMLDEIELRDGKLARHRANLEIEIAERTQDYRLAKESADAANAAKSEFLATMSHEIRTPMNGILVMAELLAASELAPKQKRFADVIARSGSSLLAIINDILDFSKIEAGRIELEALPLAIEDIVENVAQLFDERARSKGLDLSSYVAPDIPARIAADPVRLNQILSNLVNNALKFTESGEVNLQVCRDPARPTHIRFAISDTGIGIAPDKVGQVFEAFSQADQTTTRKFGGTGLGLAICKRLAEAMEGQIWAESRLGEGSCFYLSVPIVHVDRLPGEKDRLRPLGKGRVLLAVAGSATQANLARYLAEFGFDVADVVGTATQAQSGETKLVIADAALLGDPSIARLLRRAPTIAIGAFGDAQIDQLLAQGIVQNHLVKPISRRDLRAAISDTLVGRSPEQSRARQSAVLAEAALPNFSDRFILVADDNPVNREVIIETLRRFELPCDIAVDGRAAIAAAQAKTYDLIFMDGSMPDIDGFEASKAIRAWEQETGRARVPIVALTAHVVGAHAQAWKESGMDGVLHKPFTIKAMAETLLKHLPARPRLSQAEWTAREAAASETSLVIPLPPSPQEDAQADPANQTALDAATTEQLMQMAAFGGFEPVARIYNLYLENGPAALGAIEAALAQNEAPAIGKAAHALKSMSLSIGAREVADLAGSLEHEARWRNGARFHALYSEIAQAMARSQAAIRQLLAREGQAAQAEGARRAG